VSETSPAQPSSGRTLTVADAGKSFNGIQVLSGVSFGLRAGEVCALIGQNGSGKSTLIKVLSGFHTGDPGVSVHIGGREITGDLGAGAERTGMAFIHQDLALVPSMTIVENLRITRFRTGFGGRIRWRDERAVVRAALARVGLSVSPDAKVGELAVTERALVAIARGLSEIEGADGQLLVLDEPTAYLPHTGVERLFEVIRGLAAGGTSILFVSHRLDEVLAHCDRVLVLRNGRLTADEPVAGHSSHSLVELMLGQASERMYPDRPAVAAGDGGGIEVLDLVGRYAAGVSFAAAPGEIVGFAGLPGGGYDEIPYLLSGAVPARAGTVRVDGREWPAVGLRPKTALRQGIAMLPADRKASGGALTLTAGENMTLPVLGRFAGWGGVLKLRTERRSVLAELARFDVRPRQPDLSLALMSGGNQQKVLLAKWLLAGPRVLALHEPTQGVDIGAKRDVFAHLAALAGRGTTVLVSSVEYEDLAHLCDRVHVVAGGRVAATLSGSALTAHQLAAAVYA
jgi:ribose transport system ATP-binding protein